MMMVALLVVAAILVSISYMAMRLLSEVVVTPPTPSRELADQPRELLRTPGEKVIQLQVSPDGSRLALIAYREAAGESVLRVYSLDGLAAVGGAGGAGGAGEAPVPLYERGVRGYRLGWLGSGSLVYEDLGDIWRLDDLAAEPANLTADSPDLDSDPLPSPDGRFVLFKRAQEAEGGRVSYWYMRADGSDPRRVGPLPEMVSWSPDALRLASYQRATRSESTRPGEYYLELVKLPGGTGDLFARSSGETRYVDWLDDSTLVYVAMYITSDLAEVKGVVYGIGTEPGASEKGLGTLKSLNDPDAAYTFYFSRDRGRLAYLGSEGLEFFDLDEEKVYRETLVPFFSSLDWMPGEDVIIYAREDIVYSMEIDTGNTAPLRKGMHP